MRDRAIAVAFAAAFGSAACIGHRVPLPRNVGETRLPSPDQMSLGAKVFADRCAGCHGERGQGTTDVVSHASLAPPIVGPEALPLEPPNGARQRTMPFRTAADLVAFVRAHAPLEGPAELAPAEALAVTAFLVEENGTELEGEELTQANAPDVVLHEEPARGGGPP